MDTPLHRHLVALALGAALLVCAAPAQAAAPGPDRLTLQASAVELGWEVEDLNPAGAIELEWILSRRDLRVLTWNAELGTHYDRDLGTGLYVGSALARHWHTWRGAYAGVRVGLGLQGLARGAAPSALAEEDPATWSWVARVPVGVEVGWQHPARGWRVGLRAEQVVWTPYVSKLPYRFAVQSSAGAVVSVPLFWKRGPVKAPRSSPATMEPEQEG